MEEFQISIARVTRDEAGERCYETLFQATDTAENVKGTWLAALGMRFGASTATEEATEPAAPAQADKPKRGRPAKTAAPSSVAAPDPAPVPPAAPPAVEPAPAAAPARVNPFATQPQ